MTEFIELLKAYENYVFALGVIIAALILNKSIRFLLNNFFNDSSKELKVDRTRYAFFKNAVSLIIFTTATAIVIYSIPALHSLSLTIFASAGIFAAILGFASQQAFSNIISGIFIVIFKPFRVGDWIHVADKYTGIVEDITLRHVVITNFQNKRIIIPNSIISSETIINAHIEDNRVCEFCEYGISYDSDMDKAMAIITEECEKHPDLIDGRSEEEKLNGEPKVRIRVVRWEDSSVILRAYIWAKDPIEGVLMHYDLNYSIKKRFDNDPSIDIPFPHRTVYFKNQPERT